MNSDDLKKIVCQHKNTPTLKTMKVFFFFYTFGRRGGWVKVSIISILSTLCAYAIF